MVNSNLKWVLLVDDDGTTNMLNTLFLKRVLPDVKIDTAINGHRALDFLDSHIDEIEPGTFLLVLDIEMPLMDGWEFLEAYNILFKKEEREKIALTVLTARPSEEVKYRALSNNNVCDCLYKPLSDINFKKIVKNFFTIENE
ncbi:response regulator [uncultured Kriegella sp.]|uniref:response regulator n=1 Tax=uncultured Kriegella sp. TaxID=1798910 RepID=UPI0030DC5AD6|tara:strand:+ start:111743 stop:112168 length:426 start_codon:yes stop_codon:yes gene_type:complete